mmetsp:Transcript_4529/g.9794  ORF Transcript_4529/g.9794 Transcript_4529/m.9794 type:complete len:241 (-) Transcript_4529:545-1267(-)
MHLDSARATSTPAERDAGLLRKIAISWHAVHNSACFDGRATPDHHFRMPSWNSSSLQPVRLSNTASCESLSWFFSAYSLSSALSLGSTRPSASTAPRRSSYSRSTSIPGPPLLRAWVTAAAGASKRTSAAAAAVAGVSERDAAAVEREPKALMNGRSRRPMTRHGASAMSTTRSIFPELTLTRACVSPRPRGKAELPHWTCHSTPTVSTPSAMESISSVSEGSILAKGKPSNKRLLMKAG